MMVGRLPRPLDEGTTISEGVMASAQGLLDGSSVFLLVLLSVLRSLILLGSPLTARVLVRPEELDPEFEDSANVLEPTLDVSMVRPKLGDLPRETVSSSIHPAGVGGTGPKFDNCPGLRVGGDTTRSVLLVMLCDLDVGGGGPGGGGGSGIPGSHLVIEEARDCEDDVLIAPAEAALREAGGLDSTSCK